MANLNPATVWFLVAVLVIGGLFDGYLLATKGAEATISRTLYVLAQRYPVIPFAMGVLAGHLFWLNI